MAAQPPLPDLPPMQAAPSTPAPAAASSSQAAQPGTVTVKGRLRQIVGYIGGASLGFIMLASAGELALKPGLRPTDLVAIFEARTDLGIFNQKLGVEPGKLIFTEADYRSKLAEAERNGQAKAELVFQREMASVQADRERVVAAYTTLYQRANIIAQAALQLESLAQQFRQQLLAMSSGGRSMVIGIKDLFCGLGDEGSCASAHEDRRSMIAEADELSQGDVGAKVRELMAGVEDPAAFITREDMKRNGTPVIDRR